MLRLYPTKSHLALLISAALFASAVFAKPAAKASLPTAPDTQSLSTLGEIDGESDDKTSLVTIRLDRKPDWEQLSELTDHGSFLQLSLPGTLVPEPGKFIDVNSPYIKKVAVFQMTPHDAAVRLFVSENAARLREASSIELLDKRIVLALDHDKLKRLSSPVKAQPAVAAPAIPSPITVTASVPSAGKVPSTASNGASGPTVKSVATEPSNDDTPAEPIDVQTTVQAGSAETTRVEIDVPSADSIIAKTAVESDSPAPSDLLKGESDNVNTKVAAGLGLKTFNLRDKLIQVAIFLGALLALFGVSLALRPYIRRRNQLGDEPAPITMKTLATLPLAARQKISVVQIGDQRILIGVTADQVSFLTTLVQGSATGNARVAPRLSQQPAVGLPRFDRALGEAEASMELRPKPTLKNIEGNDEASLSTRTATAPAPVKRAPAPAQRQALEAPKPKSERPGATGAVASEATSELPRRPAKASRINIAVGDDGVKDLGASRRRAASAPDKKAGEGEGESQKAIDDVTRLIREKLKNLRTI